VYGDKDAHLTWNVLLHYLVKVEDSKMYAIYTAYTINCCCVPVFMISLPVIYENYSLHFCHLTEIYLANCVCIRDHKEQNSLQ